MSNIQIDVSPPEINLDKYFRALEKATLIRTHGKVQQIIGLVIESEGPGGNVGDLCFIYPKDGKEPIRAEVVGFKDDKVLLMPLGELKGIGPGCEVRSSGRTLSVEVGPNLLGRILDGLGNPIDGKPPINTGIYYPLINEPPNPFLRPPIKKPLATGVRIIDTLLTLGRGQRMGIFAGSGVGKSTTLGMIARETDADVNVLALIGERGRELRDFIENILGEEGMARSVVVVATSDQPALVRLKGAYTGTAVAEYFRDQGMDVMLMMDSVTRFAMAQREVGLAVGEPPAQKGYTPSVFALLPRLLERAGTAPKGSITGIYTVLVEGEDMNEPIADCVRSILDGHIELSRKLAAKQIYPCVNLGPSVSRLFNEVTSKEHRIAAGKFREALATYETNEDLINIGAYKPGNNPKLDWAVQNYERLIAFRKQGVKDRCSMQESIQMLIDLVKDAPF